MKKFTLLLGTVILVLLPMKAWSQEAYAWLSSDKKTFTFCYDDQRASRTGTTYDLTEVWSSQTQNVTTVVFNPEFANVKPTSTVRWFQNMSKVTEIPTLKYLDTSEVTSMSGMFSSCNSLQTLDLSKFDTGKVTDFSHMFNSCKSLTSIDVSNFDTSAATNMFYLFYNCSELTTIDGLSNFITDQVTNMGGMFSNCSKLENIDLSSFTTASVTSMATMFEKCSELSRLDVSHFNTDQVTNMNSMFNGCSNLLVLDVSNFNTENVTYMNRMFNGCKELTELDVSKFDTRKVSEMSSMFSGCSGLTSLDVSNFSTGGVWYMDNMFSGCSNLTDLDVSNFTGSAARDLSYMFSNCSSLTSLTFGNFKASNARNMSYMFYNCSSLKSLDLGQLSGNTYLTNIQRMFCGCSSLTSLDLGQFYAAFVTNMNGLFEDCSSLKSITFGSSFNTIRVTNMTYMFKGCSSLTDLDVSKLKTPLVTNMSSMFQGCGLKDLDISHFDLSNIASEQYTQNMLACPNLQTLKISSSMENLFSNACTGVGSSQNPCLLSVPEGFNFGEGVDTSGGNFEWKSGIFRLNNVKIVISSAGLATFCFFKDLDFSGVTEYKAYVVGGFNSNTGNVTLVRVSDVPAGTGLILKGTAGTYDVPMGVSKSLFANYLIGTTEAVTIQPTEGNKTNLVLSSKNGKIGFYPISSAREVGAYKAYLQLPTSILSANGMGFEFEDETTGINGVEEVVMPDVVWYTIDGRKLDAMPTQKGMYIANGRKVVVK